MRGAGRVFTGRARATRRLPQRRGALVLVYHRIACARVDPWALAVSPAHFDEHLELIARWMRPLRARDLTAALDSRRPLERAVLVTFDDGYAGLLEDARPRLERFEVPATAFVVSGAVGGTREFWWDALARVVLETRSLPAALTIVMGGIVRRWAVGDAVDDTTWRAWQAPRTSRQSLYRELWELLAALGPDDQRAAVDDLLDWAAVPPAARPSHRVLTTAELEALAAGDLVEIGAHTVSHASLARLPASLRQQEIVESRNWLRETLGRPIESFSYPYGDRQQYAPATAAVLRDAGFSSAFANVTGIVSHRTDRYWMPRLFIDDCDGDQLARVLHEQAGLRIRS